MTGLNLSVRDGASPDLQRLFAEGRGGGAVRAAARGGANFLRDHFAMLDRSRPNKQGFPRAHFWDDIRSSVSNPVVSGEDAIVGINDFRFMQKLLGGDIFPGQGKKFLTLPAAAESYNKRARGFNDLEFEVVRNPATGRLQPALVQANQTQISYGRVRKDGTRKLTAKEVGGDVLYWLARHVHQNPDPSALPKEQDLMNAALGGADEWFKAFDARKN